VTSVSNGPSGRNEPELYELLKGVWTTYHLVSGTVYAVKPFGMFVDLGIVIPGLLEFVDAGEYHVEDPLGMEVVAVVAGFTRGIAEVKLSAKPEHLAQGLPAPPVPAELLGRPSLFRGAD
jgi:hypothetical protein